MKAAVFDRVGSIRIADRDLPGVAPDGVLLRVSTAGICMTDAHIFLGHFPVPPPRVLGHELCGVVEAIGERVDPAWLGESVAVRPARFCGRCWPCQNGRAHLCASFRCLGNTDDGGFAEYAAAGADQLIRLAGMPPDRAVWTEPLACVLHAIEVANVPRAGAILISGAGTLGQLAVRALRLVHDARVAVADPNSSKVERAIRAGAEAGFVVPRAGAADEVGRAVARWAGESLSAVIETSGKPVALERSVAWSTVGTRIVLFGVGEPHATARLSPAAVLTREIELAAAAGMTNDAFARATLLLTDSRLDTDGLVEATIGLDRVPETLQAMTRRSAGKVLVHF
jgi:threonine dehydrogenase-like Zn-dependent dehydrogenase